MPYNKSFIDQASSVKMAGYWSNSLFAFLWTSPSSRSIKTKTERELGQYPAILVNIQLSRLVNNIYIDNIDQASSVKMAGYWPSSFFAFSSGSMKPQKENEANIQQLFVCLLYLIEQVEFSTLLAIPTSYLHRRQPQHRVLHALLVFQ